ncbi:MAG TPA: acyltransferase [Pirellulales bacterium]|nr:acyltransferase [Pirellulales bacterium]
MSTTTARAAEPATARSSGGDCPRWQRLDFARLAAAYTIVWLHTPRTPGLAASKALGRFAVPFFVFAAVFLVFDGIQRKPRRPWGEYFRSRLVRIYLPFLGWSGIYLLFKFAKGKLLPDQPNDFPGWSILWAGSFYHLWFMPFILVSSLLAFAIAKAVMGRAGLQWLAAGAALAAGAFVLAMPDSLLPPADENPMVIKALPSLCWAVTFAILYSRGLARWIDSPGCTLFAGLVAVGCSAWVWQVGRDDLAETVAGLAVLIAALGEPTPGWMARLGNLGGLAYGIYLSHLLFVKSFESLANKLHAEINVALDLSIFAAAAVASTALTWALSRFRATSWLVG